MGLKSRFIQKAFIASLLAVFLISCAPKENEEGNSSSSSVSSSASYKSNPVSSTHFHYMWKTRWVYDDYSHFHQCYECNERYDEEPHRFDEDGICEICFHGDVTQEQYDALDTIELDTPYNEVGEAGVPLIYLVKCPSGHILRPSDTHNASQFKMYRRYSSGIMSLIDINPDGTFEIQSTATYLFYVFPSSDGGVSFTLTNTGPHKFSAQGFCSCGIYKGVKIENNAVLTVYEDETAYFYVDTGSFVAVQSMSLNISTLTGSTISSIKCYYNNFCILNSNDSMNFFFISGLGEYYFALSCRCHGSTSAMISININGY